MILGFSGSDAEKLVLSLLLGTVIGIERELSEKPAGLKTNVLICLGSTVFTLASIKAWLYSPTRFPDFHVAGQIVTGIGFLGAGAIMREGERVTGLTTAAIIWVDAAIGMSIGMGFRMLAALTTLCTLGVQVLMTRLDILIDEFRQRMNLRIISAPNDQSIAKIENILKSNSIHIMSRKVMKKNNLYQSEWRTTGSRMGNETVLRQLLESDTIIEVHY